MFTVMLVAANALGLESLANVFSRAGELHPERDRRDRDHHRRHRARRIRRRVDHGVGGRIARRADARARRKGGVIVLAIFMALQELGIATEIVTTAFAILFGAIALAIALSFGLGNRELAGGDHARVVRAIQGGARRDRSRTMRSSSWRMKPKRQVTRGPRTNLFPGCRCLCFSNSCFDFVGVVA